MNYFYWCHSVADYKENCLAKKCFMYNVHRENELKSTKEFCVQRLSSETYHQTNIWILISLILYGYIPWFSDWKSKAGTQHFEQSEETQHEVQQQKKTEEHQAQNPEEQKIEMSDMENAKENKENNKPETTSAKNVKMVRLFGIDRNNCKYYPWIGKWFYNLFQDNRFPFVVIRAVFCLLILLPFYVWWFLIVDLVVYRLEFFQRKDLKDALLLRFELLLACIWNGWSISFAVFFIYATVGNVWFLFNIYNSQQLETMKKTMFFNIETGTEKENFKFIHRPTFLSQLKFWNNFRIQFTPKRIIGKKIMSYLWVILLLPLMLLAFIIIFIPFYDIVLHIPWNAYQTSGKKNKDKIIVTGKIFLVFLYCVSHATAYVFPTAQVYSMIVNHTLLGLMKHWDFHFPILVLAFIFMFHFIKLVQNAFHSLRQLELLIFNEYRSRYPDFDDPKGLIIQTQKDDKYDYEIQEEFLFKKCCSLLKPAQFSMYSFCALGEMIGLLLFIVIIGLSLNVINDNSSLGKVVMIIFVSFIPRVLDTSKAP